MIRRIYIVATKNPYYRQGQYLIVDEDREFYLPAEPVRSGERGKFRVEARGLVEIPFETIAPFCQEVGKQNEEPQDDSDDEGFIL